VAHLLPYLDFLLHVNLHLRDFFQTYGTWVYALLFLVIFCETGLVVTPFLPGDSLIFAAGALSVATHDALRLDLLALVLLAAPLFYSGDMSRLDEFTINVLCNPEVIAVDQDPLGIQGKPISTSTTLEVWSKKLSGTDTYAVVLFNRTTASADITVTWTSLGLTASSATVRDLWSHTDLGSTPTQ